MGFREIDPTGFAMRSFYTFDKEWALLSAGSAEDSGGYNTMTVSWGTLGTLWNMPVSTVYCRPQRYTREFLEREGYYTLSFFGGAHMQELGYLGANSGRDGDKVGHVQFTPVFDDKTGAPYFEQAQLVLLCRKLYADDLKTENFLDRAILQKDYPSGDLHRQYIGEVVRVLMRD